MMRNRMGKICMILGAVLILAALSLFLWNQWESDRAGASARKILLQVKEQMKMQNREDPSGSGSEKETAGKPVFPDPEAVTMTETVIDGYAYVGYLSIPALGLELPVMSEWDDTRLDIAACRYFGTARAGNLIICAHNYADFFGPIRNLEIGAAVYFTDMEGVVWEYEVDSMESLHRTNVEGMFEGDWDLTLFTCTPGWPTRVTVRCVLTGNGSWKLNEKN